MPPSRSGRRADSRRQTPDPKQRSISEFFAPRSSPPKRKPTKLTPSPSYPASNANPTSREAQGSKSSNPSSQTKRPDGSSKKVYTSLNSGTSSDSTSEDEYHGTGDRKCQTSFKSFKKRISKTGKHADTDLEKKGDTRCPMEVETQAAGAQMQSEADDVELPLSQDAVEVQSQLQALDCSLDEQPRSRSGSPWKRRADLPIHEPLPKRPAAGKPFGINREQMEDEKTPSTPDSNSVSEDSDDDSDDDSTADLYEGKLGPADTAGVIRRSLRTSKETVRFSPSKNLGQHGFGFSVFSDSLIGRRTDSRSVFKKLKAMEKEKSAKAVAKEEIEVMKQELAAGDEVLSEREAEIRDIAFEEDKKEVQRLARWEKYSAPVPLFSKLVRIPKIDPELLSHPHMHQRDYVHDVLSEALRPGWDGELALSSVAIYLEQLCEDKWVKSLDRVTRTAFQLLIYDESPSTTVSTHRDDLFRGLCAIARSRKLYMGPDLLPTFQQVMEVHGAFFDKDPRSPATATQTPCKGSLDALATDGTKERDLLMMATRNLKRACIFSAERIRHGHDVRSVLSHETRDMDEGNAVLYGFALCIRILISEYGCRLFRETGAIIAALLDKLSVQQWRECRLKLAKQILRQTSRLGLHVELVTRLLPCNTKRTRLLRFEVAFLSLMQWAYGPELDPDATQPQAFTPSAEAEKFGTEDVSFCVADVLLLLRRIPELQKSTDDEWASRLAKIIMQTLCDKRILQRRSKGEIGYAHQILQKFRTCTHRMTFGVPVQEMRLALDATLTAVRELLETSSAAQGEILPQLRSDMTQTLLSKPIA
eukprot:GFKZ01012644.1.p1 GENE.GFKZ01012644.1~~GFKZ01012644.1.p1  ORF type:complete len:817 (+),score=87.55 GFKZ01012644.1:218-2668(+)